LTEGTSAYPETKFVKIDGVDTEIERRWYLKPGHVFQFDRQARLAFGGVVLPLTDDYG
jgi:hypothetical protein